MKEGQEISTFSFHSIPRSKVSNKNQYSLNLLNSYSAKDMEFVEAVMVQEDVLLVAGVSKSEE